MVLNSVSTAYVKNAPSVQTIQQKYINHQFLKTVIKKIISPHFWDDSLCHCLTIRGLTTMILLPVVATGQKFGKQISWSSTKEVYTVLGTVHVFQEKMQSSVGKSLLVFWLIKRYYCPSDREPITNWVWVNKTNDDDVICMSTYLQHATGLGSTTPAV